MKTFPLFSKTTKASLLILPVIYSVLTFLFWYQCKSFFASYPDRIYVYLISALDMAGGHFNVGEFQHPGTPVHWISGLTLFITHLFTGKGPLAESVFSDPEFYLRVCAVVIASLFVLSVYMSGLLVLKYTGNTGMALLFQLVPISSYLALQYLMIMPEALLIITLTYYSAFLWVLCYTRNKFTDHPFGSRNHLYFFSFVSALIITTKVTCLPFLIIPLFFIRTFTQKITYLITTVIFVSLIIYPIWAKIPEMVNWLYGVASHSGQYGSGKAEVVNTASFFPDLYNLFSTELFFSIGYIVITAGVIAGLILKKRKNNFYTLALACWITITIQIVLTIKHYSYHYILPAQLLIIPGVLAAYMALNTFSTKRVISYSVLGICFAFLLYHSTVSASIYKDGNKVYESSLVAKKYAGIPKIITTTYEESCFVESPLNYSVCYSGTDYPSYYYFLRKLYPNSYFYDLRLSETIKWWDIPISPAELVEKNPELLVYFKGRDESEERNIMKRFTRGVDSSVKSIRVIDYNAATGERFYMVDIDTSKTKLHYDERINIKYDFEKKSPDQSAFLASDGNFKSTDINLVSTERHFSGSTSLKLSAGQYACCSSFAVGPNDAFDISVNYYSNDRPVGITLSDTHTNLFNIYSESIVEDYGNGWKRVNLKTIIPARCRAKELNFCLYYYGHQTCYVDDLNILFSKDTTGSASRKASDSHQLSKFILKASNDQYIYINSSDYQLKENQPDASKATLFEAVDLGNGQYALKAANGKFVCADRLKNNGLFANRDAPGEWETFEIIFIDDTRINIRSSNGKFVCADRTLNDALIANRNEAMEWETFRVEPR